MIRKWSSIVMALVLLCSFIPRSLEADVLTENLPEVLGSSYAVIDGESGEILFGKSYDSAVDPGSFSQIMTAILIIEQGDLQAEVTVPEIPTAVNNGNKVYLREGEKVPMRDLLEAIVVYNANDAAYAAASHIGGDEETFVEKMNEKADELGMAHTTFLSSYTNQEGQTSTAQDIGLMAAYAANLDEYVEFASQPTMSWSSDAWNKDDVANPNQFSLYGENLLGIMLQQGEGQYSLAGGLQDQGRSLVAVILGEVDPAIMYEEMVALLNYGLENTQTQTIVQKDQPITSLSFGENKVVRVAPSESFSMITSTVDQAQISHNTIYDKLDLPIREGDQVGTMKIYRDEEVIKEIPMMALDGARGSINWWIVIATILAVVYLASILYRIVQQGRKKPRSQGRPQGDASWREKIPVPGRSQDAPSHQRPPSQDASHQASPQGYRKGRKPTAEGKRQLEEKLQAKRQQIRPDERP